MSTTQAWSLLPPSPTVLQQLSTKSRGCIERLLSHERTITLEELSKVPIKKRAGVLVLLYERSGSLRVLLTTRSKALRTHAGQTALPGGRVDEEDRDIVNTALREANEEVALPWNCPHVHLLCLLDPFISLHGLVVTPVVALLSDLSILDHLVASEQEVAHIFSHPLEAMLDPGLLEQESLVKPGTEDWPYPDHLHNVTDHVLPSLNNLTYRNHRFRSCASPVKGLTSDILIKTAETAYGETTKYERYGTAERQLRGFLSVRDMFIEPSSVSSSSSSSSSSSPSST
jgi:coenzyme A diphosphatase NUDT7